VDKVILCQFILHMRHGFTQTPAQVLKIPDTDQNTIQNNTQDAVP